MKLSLKQQRFADEYIISGNATEAAIKAGYSEKTAYQTGAENLKKPQVKAYIDERLKSLETPKIAKQEEVLAYLTSLMRGEQKEEVLYGIGNGEQDVRNLEVGAKERLKAAELLGKRYALFTEKADVSVDGEINVSVSYED